MSDKPATSSKFAQAFEFAEIPRSDVNPAEYNPRKISPGARARLRKQMRAGLFQPFVWNKRTGNLVGGHQRLSILDEEQPDGGFALKCAVIDVDEREERRINIALNNTGAMGDWDSQALAGIMRDFTLSPDDLAFDPCEMSALTARCSDFDFLSNMGRGSKAEQERTKADLGGLLRSKEEDRQVLRDAKNASKREFNAEAANGEGHLGHHDDFSLTIVFPDNTAKWAFMREKGLPEKDRVVPALKMGW